MSLKPVVNGDDHRRLTTRGRWSPVTLFRKLHRTYPSAWESHTLAIRLTETQIRLGDVWNAGFASYPSMEGRMIDAKTAPYGALLLRVSMGILFILHGVYLKAFVFGMTGAGKFFATLGLPEWFAWLVMLYETIGGLALIFGIYARWVALFLGVHLLFVAYVAHAGNGWVFSNKGGGYEFPLFWAIACFALTLLGDGAHALKSDGRSKMIG